MSEDRSNTVKMIVETFGVATSLIFVTSGLLNAITFFALWRINYFLVANPSDVVMSAFIFGIISAIIIGSTVLIMLFFESLDRLVFAVVKSTTIENSKIAQVEQSDTHRLSIKSILMSLVLAVMTNVSLNWLMAGNAGPEAFLKPFWYETGLNVALDADVPKGCRGAHVAWLGTSAAIVECREGIRLFRKLDDLATTRRFS